MTTKIRITNLPESNSAQTLVVAAFGTCQGDVHATLEPDQSTEFWMSSSTRLTIYEKQAPAKVETA